MLLELNYYVTQRQGAELINSQNYMIKQKDPAWSNVGETHRHGADRRENAAGAAGQDARQQWPASAGVAMEPDRPAAQSSTTISAKLILAFDRVRLARDDGLSVLIATPYQNADLKTATATLARFAADMEPAIARTLDQVDGP